jgi:hypothetical protein
LLVVVAAVVLAGCQLDVHVDVVMEPDGSGIVTVAVLVDDDALARVGNLESQLRVDDLRASGWNVLEPARADAATSIRAVKSFATPAEGSQILDELTGPDGPFRDFDLRVDEGVLGTEYSITGTVDLTGGPHAFGDDELRAALGGDPFGDTVARIEQDEGRPVAEMVDFRVTVAVPGESQVYTPSFADEQATSIDVSHEERSGVFVALLWGAVALVGVHGQIAVRRAVRSRR